MVMVVSDASCLFFFDPDSCKKLFLFENIIQSRQSSLDNAAICFHSTAQAGLAIGGWDLIGNFLGGAGSQNL